MLEQRQYAEKIGLEHAHTMELEQFNNYWDEEYMPQLEQEYEKEEADLRKKHNQELLELKEYLEKEWLSGGLKLKFSSNLLNIKRKIDATTNLGDIDKANKLRERAQELQMTEMEKAQDEWRTKMQSKAENMLKRHKVEMETLMNKIDSKRNN